MGLAVGDDLTGIVSPLDVVAYHGAEAAARRLADIARRLGAERIVLGLPAGADGSTGAAGRRTETLAAELRALGFEVALQREFLSTNEARRRARAAGYRSDRPVDDLAAQVILEEYLENATGAAGGKE
jgi:putative transcription antitermination factor YqgF